MRIPFIFFTGSTLSIFQNKYLVRFYFKLELLCRHRLEHFYSGNILTLVIVIHTYIHIYIYIYIYYIIYYIYYIYILYYVYILYIIYILYIYNIYIYILYIYKNVNIYNQFIYNIITYESKRSISYHLHPFLQLMYLAGIDYTNQFSIFP